MHCIDSKLSLQRGAKFREEMGNGLRFGVHLKPRPQTQNKKEKSEVKQFTKRENNQNMKTKQTIFAYVIAGLLTAAFVFAATPAAADCQPVSGAAVAIIGAPSPSCPVATVAGDVFDDDDNLIGTTTACLTSVTPRGDGALHVVLGHTFNLGTLVFTTQDQLVLAPIAPPLYRVNNSLTIVSGASGFLRTHGTVNFASGEVNLRFNGLICTE